MKYTKIPDDTFKNIAMNAGIILKDFDPTTGAINLADIVGATKGGINFSVTQNFVDLGDDIDNAPKNTMELKRLESVDASMTGTYVTVTPALARSLMAAADVTTVTGLAGLSKITPRNDLDLNDFEDVWFLQDYSSINDGADAGFCAVHMMNALNVGGFSMSSTDKGKEEFAFNYAAHYSIDAQDTVPYEVFIRTVDTADSNSDSDSNSDVAEG